MCSTDSYNFDNIQNTRADKLVYLRAASSRKKSTPSTRSVYLNTAAGLISTYAYSEGCISALLKGVSTAI